MDTNPFRNKFVFTIWTINGIIFLLGSIVLAGIIVVSLISDLGRYEEPEHNLEGIAGEKHNDEKWTLGKVHNLKGTPFITLELSSDKTTVDSLDPTLNYFGSSYSGYRSHPAKNIIFIDTENNDRRWLFKTNDQLVLDTRHFELKKEEYADGITQILIYSNINTDTNADGELNAKDGISLGASHPNGEKYIGLISDIQKLIGITRIDNNRLLIIYQKNGEALTAELDIRSITLGNTAVLPVVGDP